MSEPDLVAAAAVAITLLAVAGVRAVAKRAFERQVAARLTVGPDGVITGAGAIDLAAADPHAPAALLLHGFGDTPQTLTYLAAALHARGWSVRAPLLPGHGRTIQEWARTSSAQWLTAARSELSAMRRAHASVALVGLSMGAALAALLAAELSPEGAGEPRAGQPSPAVPANDDGADGWGTVDSLALLAPYFAMAPWLRALTACHPLIGALVPYVSAGGGVSILDPTERGRSLAYGGTTARLAHELGAIAHRAWAALPAIVIPTLIVQSHGDNRTTPAVAERALARLTVADKRLTWIDQGSHVITVDRGHAAVAAVVGDWLDAHVRSHAPSRQVRPA